MRLGKANDAQLAEEQLEAPLLRQCRLRGGKCRLRQPAPGLKLWQVPPWAVVSAIAARRCALHLCVVIRISQL